MIYKSFRIKTKADWEELTPEDRKSCINQFYSWVDECPIALIVGESAKNDDSVGHYPSERLEIDAFLPVINDIDKPIVAYCTYTMSIRGDLEIEGKSKEDIQERFDNGSLDDEIHNSVQIDMAVVDDFEIESINQIDN